MGVLTNSRLNIIACIVACIFELIYQGIGLLNALPSMIVLNSVFLQLLCSSIILVGMIQVIQFYQSDVLDFFERKPISWK
jgi:hypothetical protein